VSSLARIWSPGFTSWSAAVVAALPEANARPYWPFSKSARAASRAWRVGLPEREYSKPSRNWPMASCWKVEVW
jgi:hypothetical protein